MSFQNFSKNQKGYYGWEETMGLLLNILFGKPKEKPQEDKRDWLNDMIMLNEIFEDEEEQ